MEGHPDIPPKPAPRPPPRHRYKTKRKEKRTECVKEEKGAQPRTQVLLLIGQR